MFLVLLGPPCSGKGTQSEMLCRHYNIPHISTGEILRRNIKEGTALGKKAAEFIHNGMFVPDEIMMETVKKRIAQDDCAKGFLTDGFPRTLNQAIKLDELRPPDKTVNIDAPYQTLVDRVCGRRVCACCGKNFHTFNYSKDVCECGGVLITRKDDTEETFKTRYELYKTMTEPIASYYQKQGKLVSMDGSQTPEQVFKAIKAILG